MHPRAKKVNTILLLIVGVQIWLTVGHGYWGRTLQLKLLLLAAGLSLIPPLNRRVAALLYRLRRPAPRRQFAAAVVIAMVAALYLLFTAHNQHRDFLPTWQDEFCYLIQMHMLAIGRLWMPAHPLGEFFDSFMLLNDPVYAPIYFPGAAMMYVPSVWLGLATWVIPLIVSAAAVGLLYRIVTQLINGIAGALAALLLLSSSGFRAMSIMLMAQPVMLLLGLLMIWAQLRWRGQKKLIWALAIGACAGWAAITRPLDALCFAIPVGIAVILDLRREKISRCAATLIAVFVGAAPFLLVQGIFNHRITGTVLDFPFDFYARRDNPQTTLGFHKFDSAVRPQSQLRQKQDLYDSWSAKAVQSHRPEKLFQSMLDERLPYTIKAGMPQELLLILVPAGWLALNRRRRGMLWSVLPMFIGLYAFYPIIAEHYAVIAAPAVILNVLLGANMVKRAWPRRRGVHMFVRYAIVTVAILNTRELNSAVQDMWYRPATIAAARSAIAQLSAEPAIVLFRYHAGENPHEEPVYNADAAYPDDARIIRAHDLGAQENQKLFRYYAQRQPDREVYRFDRSEMKLQRLGHVRELVNAPVAGEPTTNPR